MIFQNKRVIGKSDRLNFPDWGLENIPVKIDSGAYGSSIDCSFTKVIKRDGKRILQYILLREEHPLHKEVKFETAEFKTKRVKSSNGMNEKRYLVKTRIVIFDKTYLSEFSLSTRPDMKFPILIGRKVLNKNFIIDTSKANLSYRHHNNIKKETEF